MLQKSFFFLACVLAGFSVHANSLFHVEELENRRIRLVFEDGREAETFTSETKQLRLPISMDLTENICNTEQIKAHCSLILPAKNIQIKILWTKNPDAAKLNKSVSSVINGVKTDLVNENVVRSVADRQAYGLEPEVADAYFACDDYGWLTGQPGQDIPRRNSIFSWGGEINLMNSETGSNDNTTITGALNVEMVAVWGRMYRIESAQYNQLVPIGIPFISTGPLNMTYRSQSGEICQATFSEDISKVNRVANEAILAAANQIQKGFISKRAAEAVEFFVKQTLDLIRIVPATVVIE